MGMLYTLHEDLPLAGRLISLLKMRIAWMKCARRFGEVMSRPPLVVRAYSASSQLPYDES